MLKAQGFLEFLIKSYEHTQTVPGFGYVWIEDHQRIKVVKKKRLLVWSIMMILLALFNAATVGKYKEQGDISSFSFSILVSSTLVGGAFIMWLNYKDAETCAKFLNSLLELEEQMEYNGENEKPKFASAFCKTMLLTETVTPWVLGLGCGLLPCSPPNILAPLNPLCGRNPIFRFGKLAKALEFIVTASINGIIWQIIIKAGIVACFHILIGFVSQRTMLRRLCRNVNRNKFDVKMYRKTQLINTLFNQFHESILFVVMAASCVELACTLYVLFHNMATLTHAEIPLLVIFWDMIAGINLAIIILYMFGVAGSLHTLAVETLEKVRRQYQPRNKRVELEKALKACCPIKIAFGWSNYIEKTTPLKFLEYSVEQFIDLLLLGRK